MGKQIENLKAELKKIGILTEQDLNNAIRDLPPLKLYIMTGRKNGLSCLNLFIHTRTAAGKDSKLTTFLKRKE